MQIRRHVTKEGQCLTIECDFKELAQRFFVVARYSACSKQYFTTCEGLRSCGRESQGSAWHWFLLFSASPHKKNCINEDHFDRPNGKMQACGFLTGISPRGEIKRVQRPSKDPVTAAGESSLCTDPWGPFPLGHSVPPTGQPSHIFTSWFSCRNESQGRSWCCFRQPFYLHDSSGLSSSLRAWKHLSDIFLSVHFKKPHINNTQIQTGSIPTSGFPPFSCSFKYKL